MRKPEKRAWDENGIRAKDKSGEEKLIPWEEITGLRLRWGSLVITSLDGREAFIKNARQDVALLNAAAWQAAEKSPELQAPESYRQKLPLWLGIILWTAFPALFALFMIYVTESSYRGALLITGMCLALFGPLWLWGMARWVRSMSIKPGTLTLGKVLGERVIRLAHVSDMKLIRHSLPAGRGTELNICLEMDGDQRIEALPGGAKHMETFIAYLRAWNRARLRPAPFHPEKPLKPPRLYYWLFAAIHLSVLLMIGWTFLARDVLARPVPTGCAIIKPAWQKGRFKVYEAGDRTLLWGRYVKLPVTDQIARCSCRQEICGSLVDIDYKVLYNIPYVHQAIDRFGWEGISEKAGPTLCETFAEAARVAATAKLCPGSPEYRALLAKPSLLFEGSPELRAFRRGNLASGGYGIYAQRLTLEKTAKAD